MRLRRPFAMLAVLAACGACVASDREAEVREFLAEAVAAAESRDTGFFRRHISPSYADRQGRSRDDLLALVRGYFLLHADVEVLSRVVALELDGDDFATVVVQAALIGERARPGLPDLDADLQSFDLELARDGSTWMLIGADWQ